MVDDKATKLARGSLQFFQKFQDGRKMPNLERVIFFLLWRQLGLHNGQKISIYCLFKF